LCQPIKGTFELVAEASVGARSRMIAKKHVQRTFDYVRLLSPMNSVLTMRHKDVVRDSQNLARIPLVWIRSRRFLNRLCLILRGSCRRRCRAMEGGRDRPEP